MKFSLKTLGDFVHGIEFIELNYCIFLLKLRSFKNYRSTFNINAKLVDSYVVVGDRKCASVLLTFLLLSLTLDKMSCSTLK